MVATAWISRGGGERGRLPWLERCSSQRCREYLLSRRRGFWPLTAPTSCQRPDRVICCTRPGVSCGSRYPQPRPRCSRLGHDRRDPRISDDRRRYWWTPAAPRLGRQFRADYRVRHRRHRLLRRRPDVLHPPPRTSGHRNQPARPANASSRREIRHPRCGPRGPRRIRRIRRIRNSGTQDRRRHRGDDPTPESRPRYRGRDLDRRRRQPPPDPLRSRALVKLASISPIPASSGMTSGRHRPDAIPSTHDRLRHPAHHRRSQQERHKPMPHPLRHP